MKPVQKGRSASIHYGKTENEGIGNSFKSGHVHITSCNHCRKRKIKGNCTELKTLNEVKKRKV